ncbi:hypothetical protein L3i20_v214350 [Paenibacillus sp. L3-i20]|nr:hypothetical protein L3i20_v214350 [Paenibacillus sp. L3-i20]
MCIGWDDQHIYAVENARAVECAGGKVVSVHGRTREQLYTGKANWDIIMEEPGRDRMVAILRNYIETFEAEVEMDPASPATSSNGKTEEALH